MIKILVNGAFDLLHRGHLDLLNEAKLIGDYLLVALDTDKRISKAKGPDRPINDQDTRKAIIENLKPVDEVRLFGSDKELIDIIKETDIRFIGSDWKDKSVIGSHYACELIFFDRISNYATTRTIENIINR